MSNPFSTRHTRPGALEFLFPPGQSAASLVGRLRAAQWIGQIVGPHGSGKSTLLAVLVPKLRAAGRTVIERPVWQQVESRGKEPQKRSERVAVDLLAGVELNATTQLIIDGYEQLSWWTRRRTESRCRRQGAGLLVTVHEDVGLPLLFRTEPTFDLALQVAQRLLGADDETVATADVERAWEQSGGNLRETLFALYDLYQVRRF